MGALSARGLKEQLELPVEDRRVKQVLQECPNVVHTKLKSTSVLMLKHKESRLE